MPLCGCAAWAPLPRTVILNSLLDAIIGPALTRELPTWHAGPVVHAEHRVHRELLEQAVLDHLARAAAAFFGRLEDQVHGAVEIAVLRQVLGRAQQHRGMAVVAAGVHLAGVLAAWAKVLISCIGSASMSARRPMARVAVPFLTMPTTPVLPRPRCDRDAPFGQLGGHHVGGACFFEAEFGMGMDVAPDLLQFGLKRNDRVDQFHWCSLHADLAIVACRDCEFDLEIHVTTRY